MSSLAAAGRGRSPVGEHSTRLRLAMERRGWLHGEAGWGLCRKEGRPPRGDPLCNYLVQSKIQLRSALCALCSVLCTLRDQRPATARRSEKISCSSRWFILSNVQEEMIAWCNGRKLDQQGTGLPVKVMPLRIQLRKPYSCAYTFGSMAPTSSTRCSREKGARLFTLVMASASPVISV